MPKTFSPLRYPGGKSKLYDFVLAILKENNLLGQTYFEPFAGGAGLALKLLLKDQVRRIIINDYDHSIYAFWYSILNYTEEFCEKIKITDVTLDEWDKQKEIYNSHNCNTFEQGFSTFFLNRTNRSGVIKGGMIGGRSQDGDYLINARYNKEDLISKIKSIADKKNQIILTNMDAKELIESDFLNHYYKLLINFDPPYVIKGSQLYKNSFTENDHRELYKAISKCKRKWIVTYDICPLITELYSNFRSNKIDIQYTVNKNLKAKEYVFYSNNLILPKELL